MVKITLSLRANLENITNLAPEDENFRWYLKVRCNACGEECDKWVYVSQTESVPVKGGRGSANLVLKCKLCSRENNLDIIPESVSQYTADDQGKFKKMVSFDCRGIEPTDFSPRNGWKAEGAESGTKFADIDLTEKEWADYDEKEKTTVGIYELEHQFGRDK